VTGALIIRNGGKPDSDAGLATSTQLVLHSFDDSNASATPTVAALTLDGELGSTGSVDAHFLPSTDGKIALAAQFDVAPGMSRACYGLYSGSPVKMTSIFDDPNPDNVRPTSLVRVPGVAGYVFYGENPQYEYAIPDDPTTGAMPTRRPIAANGFVILANPNSTGKFNLASADLGTPLMPQLKLFTGQIDPTQIMTFDPKSFVLAKNATTLGEVPISAMNGYTDDFLLFAGPTGVSATELSILFLDVLGRTRAEQKLQDTRAPVNMAAIAPRGTVGGAGGKYHIAWSETNMDANGKYDVLYYDQIDCL
jgi:hypothetical protein